jgi:hypothetical protein
VHVVRGYQLRAVQVVLEVRRRAVSTDEEFACWLRDFPREIPAAEVREIGREHDALVGQWVGNQIVHHGYGEARQ